MNINNYDEATYKYIKKVYPRAVFKETNNARKSAAFNTSETEQVKMPFVSIWRESIELSDLNSFPRMKFGDKNFQYREYGDISDIKGVRAIPVMLNYHLDIWATNSETASGMFSEFLFYFIDCPRVEVALVDIDEVVNDRITAFYEVTNVQDNTEFSEEITIGRIYRYTILFKVRAFITKNIDFGKPVQTVIVDMSADLVE